NNISTGESRAVWLRGLLGVTDRILSALGPQHARGLTLAAVLVVLIVVVARPFPPSGQGRLALYFLDVGQGDSALVVFPRGSTIVVDAGGEIRTGRPHTPAGDGTTAEFDEDALETFDQNTAGIGELVVSRFLWSLGLRRLDYVLATHAHEDHIRGF